MNQVLTLRFEKDGCNKSTKLLNVAAFASWHQEY